MSFSSTMSNANFYKIRILPPHSLIRLFVPFGDSKRESNGQNIFVHSPPTKVRFRVRVLLRRHSGVKLTVNMPQFLLLNVGGDDVKMSVIFSFQTPVLHMQHLHVHVNGRLFCNFLTCTEVPNVY